MGRENHPARLTVVVILGVCLRNNVLNDNRLYQSNDYDIPHIEANYARIMSEHNAIRLQKLILRQAPRGDDDEYTQ